jgi:hypothetical protein
MFNRLQIEKIIEIHISTKRNILLSKHRKWILKVEIYNKIM